MRAPSMYILARVHLYSQIGILTSTKAFIFFLCDSSDLKWALVTSRQSVQQMSRHWNTTLFLFQLMITDYSYRALQESTATFTVGFQLVI